jgi:hypothetical protein
MDGEFFDDPKNSVGKLTTRLSSDPPSMAAAVDQRLADVLQARAKFKIGFNIGILWYRGVGFGLNNRLLFRSKDGLSGRYYSSNCCKHTDQIDQCTQASNSKRQRIRRGDFAGLLTLKT